MLIAQAATGVLDHLVKTILPVLQKDITTPSGAGYDMTESFLSTLREFVLAEAQECFWQQAVLRESAFAPGRASLIRTQRGRTRML